MRRLATAAVALGLAALIGLAAFDALRGSPEEPAQAEPTATTTATEGAAPIPPTIDDPELAGQLAELGLSGRLFLSADGCASRTTRLLRVLELPALELRQGPATTSCRFSLSADSHYVGGPESVWSPLVPVLAASTGDGLVLIDAAHTGGWELPGSVPAFAPDGDFTHVHRGVVREWTADCEDAHAFVSPSLALSNEQTGPYCARTIVGRKELGRALLAGDRPASVEDVVRADATRLLAILRSAAGRFIAAYEDGRALGYANGLIGPSSLPPRADPRGDYVALTPGGFLDVFDRDALPAWGSALRPLDVAWSPDGRWLAVAVRNRVLLVRAGEWTIAATLPLSTDGLAWRQ